MSDYLPDVYLRFRELYPQVAETLDGLGAATENAGPLDRRTQRLVKLAIAVGGLAEGAVRSNVRRALAAGATPDEVRHVALLAITTTGFPTAVASFGLDRGSPSHSVIPQPASHGSAGTGDHRDGVARRRRSSGSLQSTTALPSVATVGMTNASMAWQESSCSHPAYC